MFVHSRVASSKVNGPGNRAVIWLQGCQGMDCPGCWNPDTHISRGGEVIPVYEIANWLEGLEEIQGVTFSGGEPMQQAPHLYALLSSISRARPELSIGLFTGYTLGELESGRYHWNLEGERLSGTPSLWRQIRSLLDFAVMGRYNQLQQTNDKPLCGSVNQELHLFTARHALTDFESQAIEITISTHADLVQISGFPVGLHERIIDRLRS